MTKKEFVELFGTKAGIKTKVEADKLTKAFIDTLEEILVKGENVSFIGFGKFEAAERAARTGKNPQTGEAIKIPASKAPKFKAGKALKDVVNTPAAPAKKSKKK